jgi:hypothetical protein
VRPARPWSLPRRAVRRSLGLRLPGRSADTVQRPRTVPSGEDYPRVPATCPWFERGATRRSRGSPSTRSEGNPAARYPTPQPAGACHTSGVEQADDEPLQDWSGRPDQRATSRRVHTASRTPTPVHPQTIDRQLQSHPGRYDVQVVLRAPANHLRQAEVVEQRPTRYDGQAVRRTGGSSGAGSRRRAEVVGRRPKGPVRRAGTSAGGVGLWGRWVRRSVGGCMPKESAMVITRAPQGTSSGDDTQTAGRQTGTRPRL